MEVLAFILKQPSALLMTVSILLAAYQFSHSGQAYTYGMERKSSSDKKEQMHQSRQPKNVRMRHLLLLTVRFSALPISV